MLKIYVEEPEDEHVVKLTEAEQIAEERFGFLPLCYRGRVVREIRFLLEEVRSEKHER